MAIGSGQYRNAVASGQSRAYDIVRVLKAMTCDPTLPRYGTDPAQVSSRTFEAKLRCGLKSGAR